MRNSSLIVIVLNMTLILQGCVPAAIVGGTAAIGTTLAEERSFGQVISDAEIRTRINSKWIAEKQELNEMIEVQVREGRVLLTGSVNDPMLQIDAVRLVWEVPGVKEVIDETKVGEGFSIGSYARDTWITTKVKTELLFQENVQSLNYTVKTVNGTVYLIGIAQDQAEIDTVVMKASGVSGVNKVISYMRIKNQPQAHSYAYQNESNTNSYANSVQEGAPIIEQPINDSYSDDYYQPEDDYPYPRAR